MRVHVKRESRHQREADDGFERYR